MPATKAEPAEGKTPMTRFLRVAVTVAAVCAIGAIVAIYFGVRSPSVPTGPPRSAAQIFFNDLETSNYHDAYGMLCAITKQSFTEAQFVTGEQNKSPVESFQITKVTTQRVNGSPAANVVVNFNRRGGTIDHHNVPLVEQNGRWYVCGEPY
jgi:hypothetical protein